MYDFVLDRIGCKSKLVCFLVYHRNQRKEPKRRKDRSDSSSSQVISEMTK